MARKNQIDEHSALEAVCLEELPPGNYTEFDSSNIIIISFIHSVRVGPDGEVACSLAS